MKSILTGLVMCGGRSRRMGRDKGLILAENITWAEKAFFKLQSLDIPVMVSINSDQYIAYSRIFSKNLLIVDSEDIPGPLGGLMSAFKLFPTNDFLTLACDLPNMDVSTLEVLKNIYYKNTDYQNYAYYAEGYYESMAAVYTSATLIKIHSLKQCGKLKDYSLRQLFDIGESFKLNSGFLKKDFYNYNTKEDILYNDKKKVNRTDQSERTHLG